MSNQKRELAEQGDVFSVVEFGFPSSNNHEARTGDAS
ncbi:MAG: hypothetical protein JWM11_1453 [Planctomycetaceae bacterium]|nr:hypothetical protein [Planctomycetaceae bacterium]